MDVWNPLEKVKGGGNVPETYIKVILCFCYWGIVYEALKIS